VFTVDQPTQRTEVGRYHRVTYRLRSIAERTLYIRPMHFVSDEKASRAFLMIECFCYNDMALHPGQTVELPVVYGFNAELDPLVSSASVTYTLYPITRSEMRAKIEIDKDAPFQHPDAVREAGAQTP
jgi:cytochrome c oxidase assembly protein subunit 11